MLTNTLAADGLRSGMKFFNRNQWQRVRSVQFGSQTVIRCYTGVVISADPTDEFEVLLTATGGYDFSDDVPEVKLALSA